MADSVIFSLSSLAQRVSALESSLSQLQSNLSKIQTNVSTINKNLGPVEGYTPAPSPTPRSVSPIKLRTTTLSDWIFRYPDNTILFSTGSPNSIGEIGSVGFNLDYISGGELNSPAILSRCDIVLPPGWAAREYKITADRRKNVIEGKISSNSPVLFLDFSTKLGQVPWEIDSAFWRTKFSIVLVRIAQSTSLSNETFNAKVTVQNAAETVYSYTSSQISYVQKWGVSSY